MSGSDAPVAYANGDTAERTLVVPNFASESFRGLAGASVASQWVAPNPYMGALTASYTGHGLPADIRVVHRRAIALKFAQVAGVLRGVQEVWLDDVSPELSMTLIVRSLDLERELELRGVFIAFTTDAPSAQLSIFAVDDNVPEWARQGERLT